VLNVNTVGAIYMRLIQNTSLQSHSVYFDTPTGQVSIFLRAKASVSIPDNYSSRILNNLIARRIVRVIKVTPDIKPVNVTPPSTFLKKDTNTKK